MAFGFALQDGSHLVLQGGDSVLLLEQTAVATAAIRERDIRSAVRDLLDATSAFDGVYLTGTPETHGQGFDAVHACAIEPVKEDHQIDDDLGGAVIVHGTCNLTMIARDNDDQLADEACDRLFNLACNAVNGQSLADLTFPGFTRITRGTWLKRTPPERRKVATLEYRYLVDTWDGFGIDD
jgi:hypothetical protein